MEIKINARAGSLKTKRKFKTHTHTQVNHYLVNWFSTWVILPSLHPMGHWAVSGDISGCHKGGEEVATGVWRKVKDAARYPTMPGQSPATKNYLAQYVSSAKIEEL